MIKTIRHKGLKGLWEKGNAGRLNANWLPRIERVLDAIDAAAGAEDLDVPGFYLHALKGRDRGRHAIRVTGNWRLTFAFDKQGDAIALDLEDYH
ncbi:MAG: type II toxin-antitoxin system RelE/ParE family toxin [Alphaproteobacteria bacterium]